MPSLWTPSRETKRTRILLINPNSSTEMTTSMVSSLQKAIGSFRNRDVQILPYTASTSAAPVSINNGTDIDASARAVLSSLDSDQNFRRAAGGDVDAVLVACYSVHPLVSLLMKRFPSIPVTGIFEASILTALSLLSNSSSPSEKYGIVTTGPFWETHLSTGVSALLHGRYHCQNGGNNNENDGKFAGVFTTGLDASSFHSAPASEIRSRLREATSKLLASGDVRCVLMGCAGMAGLEDLIRETTIEQYGVERGNQVYVIDGVKAGIGLLLHMIESRRLFQAKM